MLADEINRAPAKTQAALLEAMQEGQVTIEGQTHALPKPFICVATQNPVEQEGTYPLPEAQLDRFLMNLYMDYPTMQDEKRLLSELIVGRVGDKLDLSKVGQVMSPERLLQLQLITAHVAIDDRVVQYALDIVRLSREFAGIEMGAGVRAGLALLRCAKACAIINNRDYAVPDDVRYVATDVLRHRISLTADFMIDGYQIEQVIGQLLTAVSAPQSVIHSMVRYRDGSVLAQMGNPDMRTPIAYCLGLPDRIESGVGALDFGSLGALTFREPDFKRFPCLKLAYEAMQAGGNAPCVLNAANEEAVAAFLDGKIRFTDIARIVSHTLEQGFSDGRASLEHLLAQDTQARRRAQEGIKALAAK